MLSGVRALAFLAVAEGSSLKLSFTDCGAAHGKVTGLAPDTLPLGTKTTVTGAGSVDEAVTGGTFEMDLKASIISQQFTGDLCSSKSFSLPLGTGTLNWDGLKCPLAAGAVTVPIDITLSSSLPSALQNVDLKVAGKDSAGADLLCMDVKTAPAEVSSSIPPESIKPLAIGFAEGFVSDGPELLMCGQLTLGNVVNFEQALKDFKHGVMHLNVTEIEASVNEVKDVIAAIPTAEKTCKTVLADLKAILIALKQIKGPKDFVNHIIDHMFDDSEQIFGELAAAEHAYKTGWDYMTAGQQLGMSVRRITIGEGGDAPVPAPAPPAAKTEVFEGFAIGFISDDLDFVNCSLDARHETTEFSVALKDFETGLRHFNATEIEAAVRAFEAAVKDGAVTKSACKAAVAAVEHDVEQIISALKKVKGPKDLVLKVVDNLFANAEAIFGDMSTASKSYHVQKYMGAGRDLGMALRLALVGSPNATRQLPDVLV